MEKVEVEEGCGEGQALLSAWMLPCDPCEAMFNVLIDAKVLIVVVGESDIEDDHVEGDNGKVIVVKVIYCLTED